WWRMSAGTVSPQSPRGAAPRPFRVTATAPTEIGALSLHDALPIFTGYSNDIVRFADWFSNFFHNGYLRSYHMKIILFAEALLIYKLWQSGPIQIDFDNLTPLTIYEVAVVIILLGALVIVISTPSRLTSVVAMSVIGYCICLMYVFYSAPDLAMTQFTIDTLSTVLF